MKSLKVEFTGIPSVTTKKHPLFVHMCSKDSVCSVLIEYLDLAAHWSSEASRFLETFSTKGWLLLCFLLWTNPSHHLPPLFFLLHCPPTMPPCSPLTVPQFHKAPDHSLKPHNALRRNHQAFFTSSPSRSQYFYILTRVWTHFFRSVTVQLFPSVTQTFERINDAKRTEYCHNEIRAKRMNESEGSDLKIQFSLDTFDLQDSFSCFW